MPQQTQFGPADLGNNVKMIDLLEQDIPCRSAAYVILGDRPTLIETGSAKSHDILLAGLAACNLHPEDLAYVIITHVHLDHAGGAGQIMEKARRATLVVHPRGARHMIDPSRLWNGALQVYGESLSQLFGEMIPVPENRVLIRNDGETLDIGSRVLTFYDTPGHAKHHFTILDPISDAVFSGDALGIRYRSCFTNWPFEWIMPSTSPVDFDPQAVQTTVEKLQQIPFRWVYHTHFGRSGKQEALTNTESGALAMAAVMKQAYHPQVTVDEVIKALVQWIHQDLLKRGFSIHEEDILQTLAMDLPLDALGLMHWVQAKER